jgi:geranylgeranyl diphosphate synthase type II
MEAILKYFQESQIYINDKLRAFLINDVSLLDMLYESMGYTLYSSGKRIRPIFCFIVGDLFNISRDKLATSACAVEMIHTASLIMDDLPHMDDAQLRRGKQANHLVYGQNVSSLASIGLLARAFEVVLNDPGLSDVKKNKIASRLASVLGTNGLVGGQFVDLKYLNTSMEYSTLHYIHSHKTAALFVASGEIAAIIGNATEKEIQAIKNYAQNLGFAFQILDDILDATGKEAEIGKSVNNDSGNFVTLFGIEKSKKLVQEYTESAIKAIKIFNEKSEKLIILGQMLLKRKV